MTSAATKNVGARIPGGCVEPRILVPLVISIVATVVRVLLAVLTPVVLDITATADDELFMSQALSILSGNWLGAYGSNTLVKNQGYPLILAFCGSTGISYQLLLILLVICSSLLLCLAVKPIVRSPWVMLGMYLLLLFSPLFFSREFFMRVYRNGITAPLTIIVFSGFIACYLRRKSPYKQLVPWAVASGVALALSAIIKENVMWMAPFIIVCSAWMAVGWARSAALGACQVRDLLTRCLILAIPLVITLATIVPVYSKNQEVYGVFLGNERSQGSFSKVCAELIRIDDGGNNPKIWISRETMATAMAHSDALSNIRGSVWQAWDSLASAYDENGEIPNDMAFWGLRDAYTLAGGYTNAVATETFWSAVSNDLESAEGSGAIRTRSGLSVTDVAPPITIEELPSWMSSTTSMARSLLSFDLMRQNLITSQWTPDLTRPDLLGEELRARNVLGGNTLLTQGEDDTADRSEAIDETDHILGAFMVLVNRAAALALVPGLIAIVAVCVRKKPASWGETLIILAGLLLSAFAFEAATSWYVKYVSEAYKYSAEFYALVSMTECLTFGFLLSYAAERKARRGLEANESASMQPR